MSEPLRDDPNLDDPSLDDASLDDTRDGDPAAPPETAAARRLALVEPHDAEEWVPEDDAVIGRALVVSAVVAGALALAGVGVWWAVSRPVAAPPPVAQAAAAPHAVVAPASPPPALPFHDVTAAAGVGFVRRNGAVGDKLLPETMGGGVAFFDFDGDEDADLLLVGGRSWDGAGGGASLALYRNDGAFRFTDVTAAAGLDLRLQGMGVAVGDVDGDGRRDLYVTAVGENRLLRNDRGVFRDVTRQAGVAGGAEDWSTGAAFFDLEGDGDLDLFVCNYVRWSREIDFEVDFRLDGVGRAYGPPQSYEGTFPVLYRNDGGGVFADVSEAAGVRMVNPVTGVPEGKSLAVRPIDVDGDGLLDLLVANDTVRNFFFRNRGDGTLVEEGELLGLAYDRDGNATGAMGVDAGHLRNDQDLAFVVGNFANEMTSVYVAQGDPGFFVDEAIGIGVGAPSRRALSFGIAIADFDLDGRVDLLQANGHIEDRIGAVDPSQSFRQAAQLFWNAGDDGLVALAPEALGDLARPLVGRAAAYADLDGDGDLDLVLTQPAGPPLLLRNDQAAGHHWVRLRLEAAGGERSAGRRDALGAVVELTAGGVTQRRDVMPTRGYLTQVELPVTFGLGAADRVDGVRVRWPDGSVEELGPVPVDALTVVRQTARPPVAGRGAPR